ncbi:uncharacterized protein BDCG_17102 [Blastomyces dermatitidis ER-3]|uniref:Uncharacterized protein n=1 Tax=Ajellomyces dermatitidis (strain ER-3 / ATCC MYA-2586) TaxID=559297 RepID=A0ABX2VWR3_AJEDR|nr:uncharacterized protein BDCG_17102 [Blastomyces dermatitidis ER-3]OAT01486.1 hypothetical protein BDCG_17102 [Blastomyces dermatitidis ER-3]
MIYGMSTPARGPVNRYNIHLRVGLPVSLVNERLMSNPHPRDYSITPYRHPTPPTPKTACYPHPMYPLEYWRLKISNVTYWRYEADFWRTACAAKEDQASRTSIQDTEYWKCESRFWKSTCPRVHEDARYDGINNPKYWECENMLYEGLLQPLVYAEHQGPTFHQTMLRDQGYAYDSDSSSGSPKTLRRSARLANLKQKASVNSSASQSELPAATNASSTKKRKSEDQAINNHHRKRKLAC